MASAKSLEEMLTTDVDESVVSELVGSLESQLSSSGIHTPNQELNVSSASTNHVNSVPVSDGLQRLQHDGQKHAVAAALANSCPSIVVSNLGKTIATTSHIVGVSSCASSAASSTNTVMVTLPGALPASGYINQVTGTAQQALLNTSLVRPINNSDIKIVYSPQGHFNAANLAAVNNAVLQQRGNVKIQGVPNGSTTIRSAPHTPATTPGLSAIHNLANVAAQQAPLIISQPAKPRLVLDPKDPKGGFKPQILIKQESPQPTTVAAQEFLRCSSPGVIQTSKPGSQPVNVVTQVMSSPSILPPGVQIVNVNPARPGSAGLAGQKTLAPRVIIGSPMRLAPQMLATRPGAPSVQVITRSSSSRARDAARRLGTQWAVPRPCYAALLVLRSLAPKRGLVRSDALRPRVAPASRVLSAFAQGFLASLRSGRLVGNAEGLTKELSA
ncbi:unnamed protein product [Ixodes pacificus]